MRNKIILTVASIALVASPLAAQSTTTTRDRIGQILGNILGVDNSANQSLDGQWRAGRTPLANQRSQFEAQVDANVRAGTMTQATASRLKSDYYALANLEASYGADGTYTTAEKTELTNQYNALLQVLGDGNYPTDTVGWTSISSGQAEFNRRVDAQVTARKLTRTAGTRIKSDYTALIGLETTYLRDNVLSTAERADLESRLDALDLRVGDVAYSAPVTAKGRLDAIARALPTSGLNAAARAQLLVEHGDLARLEAAYSRATPTVEEQNYLDRRLTDLETRARVTR